MSRYKINDLFVKGLAWEGSRMTVAGEDDPLLRRFGQADVVRLAAGGSLMIQREQADEVWAIVSGRVQCSLRDERPQSPSHQAEDLLGLDGDLPEAVLVPFGVRLVIEAQADSLLLRLTTHEDSANSDDVVTV